MNTIWILRRTLELKPERHLWDNPEEESLVRHWKASSKEDLLGKKLKRKDCGNKR
jgi:hypothetical protein